MENHYRHELKYQISYSDYLALSKRLSKVMKADCHANKSGRYLIRSIYFDDYRDSALQDKKNSMAKREKFRIRWYNDNLSYITLEKKIKNNNLCMKVDAPLTLEEFQMLLGKDYAWMREHPSSLVQELYCKIKAGLLRPRVMVSYVREPYVYAPGNVRITFDSHIRTSLFHTDFLQSISSRQKALCCSDISATNFPEDMILEVKYDAYFPEIISLLLQTEGIRQQAFSKYGICRRFG